MYTLKQKQEDFIVEEILNLNSHEGAYTYFILEKKNYNTEDAIQRICDFTKIHRREFGFCGNKDRNAVTRQYVSVRGKISDFNLTDINVKVVGKGDKPLSLGDLEGNRFIITVRNIEKKPKKIEIVPNYFDEQRFGRNNLEVGFLILRKKFKEACLLLDYEECRTHLERYPTDYVGAIRSIPFKTLKIFIHALQSFLWNEAAAEYISKYKHHDISYSHGTFKVPDEKIENIQLPLVTFDTEFNPEIRDIYSKVLFRNKIDIRDFVIRAIPNMTPKGGERELFVHVSQLKIGELEEDELNNGMKRVLLEFNLGKGSYATMVIREMFHFNS